MLSVVVIDSTQGTAPWVLNYATFVFDLNSGNLLKYNEVLKELSLDSEKTSASIKELLMSKMKELWGEHVDDLSSACYNDNKNCYEKAYMTFEDSINNNTLNFFVNDNGNLSLLLVPYYDGVQNGDRNKYLIELK